MPTTLEELEKRVVALEQELAKLRGEAELPPDPKPWWWDIPMLREARAQQAAISAAVAEALREDGDHRAPRGSGKAQGDDAGLRDRSER